MIFNRDVYLSRLKVLDPAHVNSKWQSMTMSVSVQCSATGHDVFMVFKGGATGLGASGDTIGLINDWLTMAAGICSLLLVRQVI